MSESLYMWTVYDHPKDFPDRFVARMFRVTAGHVIPTSTVLYDTDLKELREKLARRLGLTRLERLPGDDAKIVEVWL